MGEQLHKYRTVDQNWFEHKDERNLFDYSLINLVEIVY